MDVSREMSKDFELNSKFVSALPIVNHFLARLRFSELLDRHLPQPDPRTTLPAAQVLDVLLRNLILSRVPLYGAGEWAHQRVPELLGLNPDSIQSISDDRMGRALDRLFDVDRKALLTDFVVSMISTFDIELEQFHNDSTTITLHGEYSKADGRRIRGKETLVITWGHNKDYRPDLKQLLWILTVSADGAVPVHFKVADGNTEDSTTHIDTWKVLCRIVGHPNFLYVADSKLCTRDTLHFIHEQSGQFVTVLPRSRKEDGLFKDWLQIHIPAWQEIGRKPHPRLKAGPPEVIRAVEAPIPDADGFRLFWYHSSHKHERDVQFRQDCINRAWKALDKLNSKLQGSRCRYTTQEGVAKKADESLKETGAARWLYYEIEAWKEEKFRQEKRGRPGSKTRWRRQTKPRFRLTWHLIKEKIEYDSRTDGIFPLLTNRQDLSALQIFEAYRSKQPFVETRHNLLKNIQAATPVFLKNAGRIEALLFLFYISLTVHALIEREIRKAMEAQDIESLPLYPEERDCKAPTAARIFDVFEGLQRHLLTKEGGLVQEFLPELSPLHKEVLSLLDISPRQFLKSFRDCVMNKE